MTKTKALMGLGLCMTLAGVGCGKTPAAAESERTSKTAVPLGSGAAKAAEKVASAKITRVVFVGKEHPCDCTKKRLETGWTALQQALGTPPKIPVEQLKADTEPEKVQPYQHQKPMMALPALYFVDANDSVVDLLQGEVTREQIAATLAK